MPPSDLGHVTSHQATRFQLWLLSPLAQIHLLMLLSINSQTDSGSHRDCIAYTGSDDKTDLAKHTLPALFNNLFFQEAKRVFTLSIIGAKLSLVTRPFKIG